MSWKTRTEGYKACIEGKQKSSNPYTSVATWYDRKNMTDWNRGFERASRESYDHKLYYNNTGER